MTNATRLLLALTATNMVMGDPRPELSPITLHPAAERASLAGLHLTGTRVAPTS